MSKFPFSTKSTHQVEVPMNVTNAANTIAAIANRDDTACRSLVTFSGDTKQRACSIVPLEKSVMAKILGEELGLKFTESMANPAYKEYYEKVMDRLEAVGITLAYMPKWWAVMKVPVLFKNDEDVLYTIANLFKQSPNGFGNKRTGDENAVDQSLRFTKHIEVCIMKPYLRLVDNTKPRSFTTFEDLLIFASNLVKVRMHESFLGSDVALQKVWVEHVKVVAGSIMDAAIQVPGFGRANFILRRNSALAKTVRDAFSNMLIYVEGGVSDNPIGDIPKVIMQVFESTSSIIDLFLAEKHPDELLGRDGTPKLMVMSGHPNIELHSDGAYGIDHSTPKKISTIGDLFVYCHALLAIRIKVKSPAVLGGPFFVNWRHVIDGIVYLLKDPALVPEHFTVERSTMKMVYECLITTKSGSADYYNAVDWASAVMTLDSYLRKYQITNHLGK